MNIRTRAIGVLRLALALMPVGATLTMAVPAAVSPPRQPGPCDIYGAAGTPCVAAHSTTRALYASY
ncbi:MAG: alpha-L-arabinofuranosidase, partial [Acidobacteriia bacterium]|nr:alpha-L-arabinofuranosidase [Terriglobia bacterium]